MRAFPCPDTGNNVRINRVLRRRRPTPSGAQRDAKVMPKYGGYGSGRRWTDTKRTTAEYLCLDVRSMNRQGVLCKGVLEPGRSFELQWTQDGRVIASIQARFEGNLIPSATKRAQAIP